MHSPSEQMRAWGLPALSQVDNAPGELPADLTFVLEVKGHREWHFPTALAETRTGT